MDPENAVTVAQTLAKALAQVDAAHAAVYEANARKFKEQVEARMADWQKRLAPFAGQQVVSYHNSWVYFGRRFGLKVDIFLEPKPGIPPTPTHLAQVVERMKADKVKVVFVEPYVNLRTAERVASETGARVVPVAQFPGGVKGTEAGYVALMDYLVKTLATAVEAGK
jgi:ABC-type Zn uptake system ZnuABC Zn-binding protein ZnuA